MDHISKTSPEGPQHPKLVRNHFLAKGRGRRGAESNQAPPPTRNTDPLSISDGAKAVDKLSQAIRQLQSIMDKSDSQLAELSGLVSRLKMHSNPTQSTVIQITVNDGIHVNNNLTTNIVDNQFYADLATMGVLESEIDALKTVLATTPPEKLSGSLLKWIQPVLLRFESLGIATAANMLSTYLQNTGLLG